MHACFLCFVVEVVQEDVWYGECAECCAVWLFEVLFCSLEGVLVYVFDCCFEEFTTVCVEDVVVFVG